MPLADLTTGGYDRISCNFVNSGGTESLARFLVVFHQLVPMGPLFHALFPSRS